MSKYTTRLLMLFAFTIAFVLRLILDVAIFIFIAFMTLKVAVAVDVVSEEQVDKIVDYIIPIEDKQTLDRTRRNSKVNSEKT